MSIFLAFINIYNNGKEKKNYTTVVVTRVGYHIRFLNSYEVKKYLVSCRCDKAIVNLD